MRILMSGASGFLGSALSRHLTDQGHEVTRLVRRPARTADERRWDPYSDVVDLGAPDAVINLNGISLGEHRWTPAFKRKLVASRVEPTSVLARAMALSGHRPMTLLNASGIGYYGDTGDRAVTEESPIGEGFLPSLCRAWEGATRPAEDSGVRVVHLRTAPVLAASGGILKRLLPLFKAGFGGRLGSGRQYFPWISLADWLRAATFLLDNDLHGAVNMVAPSPVPNAVFTKVLGAQVHRPTVLAVPGFALKLALGEFSVEALTGQRALPEVLTKAGFQFEHPGLAEAMAWASNA